MRSFANTRRTSFARQKVLRDINRKLNLYFLIIYFKKADYLFMFNVSTKVTYFFCILFFCVYLLYCKFIS